jgi:holo-[acyl-carrier protein] synthase
MKSIVGVGIDICQISRINKILQKYPRFPCKILHKSEQTKSTPEFIASRFAAKEAIYKSLPCRIDFKDIIITSTGKGKPTVELVGIDLEIMLSISHEKDYATAISLAFNK